MTLAIHPETVILAGDYETVCRQFDAMRAQPCGVGFDLRSHGACKLWQQIAYLPRLDTGEDAPLRANCRVSGYYGWMD